jgi:alanine racemase
VTYRDPAVAAAALRAAARIDLGAISSNVSRLKEIAGPAEVMAVVKAEGYGHGLVQSAIAAVAGGATWLGVAFLEEALALRAAGIGGRILCWLGTPGEPVGEAITADIDVSASAPWAIAEIANAALEVGRVARVHLKIDTGLSRGGAVEVEWPELVQAAAKARAEGYVEIVGMWSHLVHGSNPAHPTTALQIAAFTDALSYAASVGVTPQIRHLANSGGALLVPGSRFDLVRPGIAVYGLSPVPDDADRTVGADEESACRHRSFVQPSLRHGCADDARPGSARLRRWSRQGRHQQCGGARARPVEDRTSHDLWHRLHGSVRGRPRPGRR